MSTPEKNQPPLPPSPPMPGKDEVQITINAKPYFIRRGTEPVVSIKKLAGIPLADELEEVIDRQFKPLPDDSSVNIKGGELFVSHPRDASSS